MADQVASPAALQTMSMAVRPATADGDLVTIGVVVDIPEPLRNFLRRAGTGGLWRFGALSGFRL